MSFESIASASVPDRPAVHGLYSFLRKSAERLSRGIELKRRLPADFGGNVIYVSPTVGGLRYWRRDLRKVDPALLTAVRRLVRPGAVVWDVGANLGLFTFTSAALAGAAGFVLAIEPDVEAAKMLLRTRRALVSGRNAPVEVLTMAVNDGSSNLERFQIAMRARASNALDGYGSAMAGGFGEIRVVPATSLDALLEKFPRPDVVKIDVEGAESLALDGASTLLAQIRPAWIIEVVGANRAHVRRSLRGYRLMDGENGWSDTADPTYMTIAVPA